MIPARAPEPSRSPWQRLYQAAHRWRYRWHQRRAAHLPRPVVSVGNLHWGGGGKTPLVAALAAHLRDEGRHVAILSRGYRSEGRGVRLVRDWEGEPRLGPRQAGDEPALLAGGLPGVAVLVDSDRTAAGRAALEQLDPKPDLFLLDDAFSHLKLARDLDLLAFPVADPWAGGRLAPAGRLREPLEAAARADALLLTGRGATSDGARALAQALGMYRFRGPGFAAPTHALPPRLLDGTPLATGSRVLLATAIARPQSFLETAEGLGFTVAEAVTFPDHHAYPDKSLARIETQFRATGADAVLTTSKDRVKLASRLQAPLAELAIEARPEAAFWSWLGERLAKLEGASR